MSLPLLDPGRYMCRQRSLASSEVQAQARSLSSGASPGRRGLERHLPGDRSLPVRQTAGLMRAATILCVWKRC